MSLSINSVVLGGNVTRDPEVRAIANGKSVAKFGLAINDRYKAGDGTFKESVTFVDCEVWNGIADVAAKYLKRGSAVVVEGKLKSDDWQTQAGEKRQKLILKVERLHLTGTPVAREEPRATASQAIDEPPF